MFIKIRDTNGDEDRINVKQIVTYTWDVKGQRTLILLTGNIPVVCKETPEQIDAKIENLGFSVGGGH